MGYVSDLTNWELAEAIYCVERNIARVTSDAQKGRDLSFDPKRHNVQTLAAKDQLVAEVKTRLGTSNVKTIREFITQSLREKDELDELDWLTLYQKGSMLSFYHEDLETSVATADVVRCYQAQEDGHEQDRSVLLKFWCSEEFFFLPKHRYVKPQVRKHYKVNEYEPMETDENPLQNGFITIDDCLQERNTGKVVNKFQEIFHFTSELGTVVYHEGFDDHFEFTQHMLFDPEDQKQRIWLAKPHSIKALVEFSSKDAPYLQRVNKPSKYIECQQKGPLTQYTPIKLTLEDI